MALSAGCSRAAGAGETPFAARRFSSRSFRTSQSARSAQRPKRSNGFCFVERLTSLKASYITQFRAPLKSNTISCISKLKARHAFCTAAGLAAFLLELALELDHALFRADWASVALA